MKTENLCQFESKGLITNEGIAVDTRLVKSASLTLSNDELKKDREHRQTASGQVE
jgi:hypothetical protein